jgi:hypothetical protein
MAAGRVAAGTVFTRPRAYPQPQSLPARQRARGRKSLPVPVPYGYPRVSGNPSPAKIALAIQRGEVGGGALIGHRRGSA